MKRTLTILSAALFAGSLMAPALRAQEAPAPGHRGWRSSG